MLVHTVNINEKEKMLDELEDRGFTYQKCYYNSAFDTDRKKCIETDKPLNIDLTLRTISVFRSLHYRWYDICSPDKLYGVLQGCYMPKKQYEKGFVTVSGNKTREADIIRRDREYSIVRFAGSNGAIRVRNDRVFYSVDEG